MLDVKIESNIEHLSARVIHSALVDLVGDAAKQGEAVLKILVPKGETGELERHVGHRGPIDGEMVVVAEVGVTPIGKSHIPGLGGTRGLSPSDSSHYPEYVDRGTGIFGPTHSPIFPRHGPHLVFEVDGKTVFATSVKGQVGQQFMAKLHAEMLAALHGQAQVFRTRVEAGEEGRALV